MTRTFKYFYIITAHLFFLAKIDALYPWHFFLKSETMLVDSQVRIGDIGNILGNDITKEQKIRLLTMVLEDSPIVESTWDINVIRSLLDRNSIHPDSIRGESVRLIVPVKSYENQELADFIFTAYKGILNDDYKVVVKKPMFLPSSINYKIIIDGSKTPGEKTAAFAYRPESSHSNDEHTKKSRQLQIPYILMIKRSVLKAIEPIKQGERLSSQNTGQSTDWFDYASKDNFYEIPTGYAVTRQIEKDAIITGDSLKKITDIKRGDKVTVIYSLNNLSIESDTNAMEQGSIGQILKFKTKNNKIIYGKLISDMKAEFALNSGKK